MSQKKLVSKSGKSRKGSAKAPFPQLEVSMTPQAEARKIQCEVVAVAPEKEGFVLNPDFSDYHALATRLSGASELSTKAGSAVVVRFGGIRGGQHAMLIGTGKDREGINALGATERMRRLGASVFHKLHAEKIKEAVVYLDSFASPASDIELEPRVAAYAFFEGMGLAAYEFKKYISSKAKDKDSAASENEDDDDCFTAIVASADHGRAEAYEEGLSQAEAMVLGASVARDLGNEPSNALNPAEFATRARQLAAKHGLKATVLDEKTLGREEMGLLLGVGQGSVNPPRLFMLEYNPKVSAARSRGAKPKTIAFVGKGVTFDSGGISIKPAARMEDMKYDMCGAASVVGAIVAAAEVGVNARILAIVAAAENMPGGRAIQPGNILKARSGKTVEITNTDAEGRLILADALDYAQDLKPDYVIDLATLTGAVTVTLGKACAALLGNDKTFNEIVAVASRESGERIWELPLFDEYFDELKSEHADMKNSGDSPSHGTAKGAMFLKQFIRKETRWVHLDMAAMAYNLGMVPYCPKKGSSGWGVRLLVELAKNL